MHQSAADFQTECRSARPGNGRLIAPRRKNLRGIARRLRTSARRISAVAAARRPRSSRRLAAALAGRTARWDEKTVRGICSAGEICEFGKGVRVIGERINPTGKKRFQQALREGDMNYIVAQAVEQARGGRADSGCERGAAGYRRAGDHAPRGDGDRRRGRACRCRSIPPARRRLRRVCAPRRASVMVNSVNASRTSLEAVLPIAKKYGAAVVGLALGENGLPTTCEAASWALRARF